MKPDGSCPGRTGSCVGYSVFEQSGAKVSRFDSSKYTGIVQRPVYGDPVRSALRRFRQVACGVDCRDSRITAAHFEELCDKVGYRCSSGPKQRCLSGRRA